MSLNQSSHFRYGAFTNSSHEVFDKVPVLEIILSSYTEEVFSSTLDESSIECEFETDRNLYLDMRDTHLSLKLQLFKERLFDAFKRKSRSKQNQSGSDEEPEPYLTYVNNLLHSLFSNCEVYFNNTRI